MEKFHQYCLSILLVISCGNISAHSNNESMKNVDFKQFCEIYNQFLKLECATSQAFFLKEKSIKKFAVNYKQNAIDVLGNFNLGDHKDNSCHRKFQVIISQQGKHNRILENFEKQSKQNDFAENIYFKSKVAKIRNKDYLDLKKMALKSYDEGKTMKDNYTHHFNKVYRAQIEEL